MNCWRKHEWVRSGAAAGCRGAAARGVDVWWAGPAAAGSTAGNQETRGTRRSIFAGVRTAEPKHEKEAGNDRIEDVADDCGMLLLAAAFGIPLYALWLRIRMK